MFEYRILIKKGQDKGSVYKINGADISIGRDSDNDLVVNHKAIAPFHVKLIYTGKSYLVENLDEGYNTFVNSKPITRQQLFSGDLVSLSKVYEFQFSVVEDGTSLRPPSFDPNLDIPTAKKGNSRLRIVLISLVVLFAILFMLPDSEDTTEAKKEKNKNELKEEDKSNFENYMSEDIDYKQKIPKSMQGLFKKAENFYLEGRREFDVKNYTRAVYYFKHALSLYPSHGKARRYLTLTMNVILKVAKEHLLLGKKLMSQFKYEEALRHFQNCMDLLEDKKSTDTYKEAEKMKERAEKFIEEYR